MSKTARGWDFQIQRLAILPWPAVLPATPPLSFGSERALCPQLIRQPYCRRIAKWRGRQESTPAFPGTK
jgi:hypothetical protein